MNYYCISIRPEFVISIFSGRKRFEIRTRIPELMPGDCIFIYETAPVSQVVGYFIVDQVVTEEPFEAFKKHHRFMGIQFRDYSEYVRGRKQVHLIGIKSVTKFAISQPLSFFNLKSVPQWFSRVE